jgi:cell division protein FtsL
MKEIIYILLVIGFLICFFKIELYLIHKSREKFKELKEAYKDLKKLEQDLHNLLKEKRLQ